ncbi:MAG TPA: hypothetical protein VM408_03965 [Methylomirabilota bacterium]|nr:hypothetical protein [Methylomirabilota bacterium]
MNGRTFVRILLLIVLVGGAIGLGVTSYNAGVTAGLVQSGQVVVAPGYPVGPYVGYGYGSGVGGHGFGFFGFLGGLVFLLLFIALIRAAVGGSRRGWGPGGPGGRAGWGQGGPGAWRSDAWEQRIKETHDALHRTAGDGPDDAART